MWSFAPRNNLYQAGIGFLSYAGLGVTGNVPLGGGHVQATIARTSTDDEYGASSLWHAHAYYLYPVLYINKSSAFEVPLFAGGGLGYASYSTERHDGSSSMSDTKWMPTLAVGDSIQFNGFPVDLMVQVTVSLAEAPLTESRLGFNVACRYVFGRRQTRDVLRNRDL